MTIDQFLLEALSAHRNPMLTQIFEVITYFGSAPVIIVMSLIVTALLVDMQKKKAALLFAGLTIFDAVTTFILKNLTQRLRPDPIEQLVQVSGFSLPSGHSSSSLFLYGAMMILLMEYAPSRLAKGAMVLLTTILVLSIGISRIYLGVHYPTDVAAGYMLGAALLVVFRLRLSKKSTHS